MVQELVDTERKYVQDLETLQDYMRALEADEVISKDLIHILFLNLNQLVDFQRRFLIRVETQNDLRPEQQTWGALFVEYVSWTMSHLARLVSNCDLLFSCSVEIRRRGPRTVAILLVDLPSRKHFPCTSLMRQTSKMLRIWQ